MTYPDILREHTGQNPYPANRTDLGAGRNALRAFSATTGLSEQDYRDPQNAGMGSRPDPELRPPIAHQPRGVAHDLWAYPSKGTQ